MSVTTRTQNHIPVEHKHHKGYCACWTGSIGLIIVCPICRALFMENKVKDTSEHTCCDCGFQETEKVKWKLLEVKRKTKHKS
jgi:hypothetical protein